MVYKDKKRGKEEFPSIKTMLSIVTDLNDHISDNVPFEFDTELILQVFSPENMYLYFMDYLLWSARDSRRNLVDKNKNKYEPVETFILKELKNFLQAYNFAFLTEEK